MFGVLRKLLISGSDPVCFDEPKRRVVVDDRDLPLYQEGLAIVNDVRAALAAAAAQGGKGSSNDGGEARMEVVEATEPSVAAPAPPTTTEASAVPPVRQEKGSGESSARPRVAFTAADLGMQAKRLKRGPTDKENQSAGMSSGGGAAAMPQEATKQQQPQQQQQQQPAAAKRAPLSAIAANQLQSVTLRRVGGDDGGGNKKQQAGKDGSMGPSSSTLPLSSTTNNSQKARPCKAPFGSPELKAVKLRAAGLHKRGPPSSEQPQGAAGGEEGAKRPRRGADQVTGMNMELLERALKQRRERVKAASLSPTRSSLSVTSPEKTGPLTSSSNRRVTRSAVKSKRGLRA